MGAQRNGMNLKGQARRIDLGIHMPRLLCLVHRARQHLNPLAHNLRDAVVHHTLPAVKLKRRGAEKTSPTKNALLYQRQPMVHHGPQAWHSLGRTNGRLRHLFDKNQACLFHGCQLQLFLGAEVSEKAALAHLQLFGQGAHGQPLQAVRRRQVNGPGQNGFARPQAAVLPAGGNVPTHTMSGFQHGGIVAQEINSTNVRILCYTSPPLRFLCGSLVFFAPGFLFSSSRPLAFRRSHPRRKSPSNTATPSRLQKSSLPESHTSSLWTPPLLPCSTSNPSRSAPPATFASPPGAAPWPPAPRK